MSFNPFEAFCEMHHDKLIKGDNPFGSVSVGVKCKAFLYSKKKLPGYFYPVPPTMDLSENEMPAVPAETTLILKRVPGESSNGYYLYLLGQDSE